MGVVVQLDHVGELLLSSNNFNEKKLLREVERLISRLEKILTSFDKVEVSEFNRVSHFPVDICPPITFSLKSFNLNSATFKLVTQHLMAALIPDKRCDFSLLHIFVTNQNATSYIRDQGCHLQGDGASLIHYAAFTC